MTSTYLRTARINGHSAFRASDSRWYEIDRDGEWTGRAFDTRMQAIHAMSAR